MGKEIPIPGLGKLLMHRFDAAKGSLTPADPPFVAMDPGAGPRHVAFAPSGKFVYVVNALTSTVTVFAFQPGTGTLRGVQTVSTLPLMPLKWVDVGSWNAFADICPKDEHGNGHLIATLGCEDLIIVHTPDATLVCRADQAEKIKELHKLAGEKHGQALL